MAATVIIIASFLLAFKAILIEGSEVAILSVATVKQLGKQNVLLGVLVGAGASLIVFLAVRTFFLLLPDILIDIGTGCVILYFSYRFLRGFKRYYFGKKSFTAKGPMYPKLLISDTARGGKEGRSQGTGPPLAEPKVYEVPGGTREALAPPQTPGS